MPGRTTARARMPSTPIAAIPCASPGRRRQTGGTNAAATKSTLPAAPLMVVAQTP